MDNKRHDRYIKNQCVCTAITEIQEVENYSGYVYDLSVEGIHRFVSNDILHKNTEREGHFLCTALVMPRFQNFAENFRNFRIKYWINIIDRGFAVIYKKDEDKDAKDPWHIDESYKLKLKQWRGKKVYERDLPSVLRMEQKTPNYWFYFRIPEMPKEIWMEYQRLKAESRNRGVEVDVSVEDYRDKLEREKMDRWVKIKEMKINGYKNNEIAAVIGCSSETIRRHLRSMEGYEKIRGEIKTTLQHSTNKINNIYNLNESDKIKKIPTEFDKM